MKHSMKLQNSQISYPPVARLCAWAAMMSILLCIQALAADRSVIGDSPADKQLTEYFRSETAKLAQRSLADIKDLDDWKAKREVYREQLLEMLGLGTGNVEVNIYNNDPNP